MIIEVAEAVHHAHQRGVIHRDLKPGNILVTKDQHPKLIDFGIANSAKQESRLTITEKLVGTPSYMAPEILDGGFQVSSSAMDVYSLGVVLYELLTKQTPFTGGSVLETLHDISTKTPYVPSSIDPCSDRDLDVIVMKCLSKQPDDRYASAGLLADDLRHWSNGEPIAARPTPVTHAVYRWGKRNPAIAALLAIIFVGTAVGFAITLSQSIALSKANRATVELAKRERLSRLESQQRLMRMFARESEDAVDDGMIVNSVCLGNRTSPSQTLARSLRAQTVRKSHSDRSVGPGTCLADSLHPETSPRPSRTD